MKRHIITIIKCALSIAILWYLFHQASSEKQFEEALRREKDWGWIFVGFFSCLTAIVIGFVRWRIMVRALGLPFGWFDAIRIGFIGLFFHLFAFGVVGGDTLRAFYVTREFKDRKPEAIASVIADRMVGLLTMLLVASIAFLMLDTAHLETSHPGKLESVRWTCLAVTSLTIIGFVGLFILFLSPNLVRTRPLAWLLNVPKLGPLFKKILAVVLLYRNKPMAILVCFVLSIGVNLGFVVSIYSIAAGMYETYPSFANHFIIEPIAMVSNAIPLPGGLGGMEYALHFLYQAFDSPYGVIVAFSYRFVILLISAIGAVFWFINRKQVEQLTAEGQTAGE